LIEPDIVKQLKIEERQGLLNNKETSSDNEYKNDLSKSKDIESILELQNGVVQEFLSRIKEGKIKTSKKIILSLYELLNYYNSGYWKILLDKISIDKQILSFYHLINTYIEHLEYSSELRKSDLSKDQYYNKMIKLKNMILTFNSVKR